MATDNLAKSTSRGQWGSRFGFIMAAAGSAVGLGNIWRFPYMVGENGGGAFVLVYLACILLIGLPLLWNEIAIGSKTRRNPIGAFLSLNRRGWLIAPILCLLLCFIVLSYYSVIAGWTIGFIAKTVGGTALAVDPDTGEKMSTFGSFIREPKYVIPLTALFIGMTVFIVMGGVSKGIEKAAKFLMPLLLLLIVIVAIRSVTLPGAGAGLEYYLKPDFSKINGQVIIAAMGQAFFSLSVGWGLMITYGSYMPKSHNIVSSGSWVGLADTTVALLGGLMVFPAVFAMGMEPAGGPGLVFNTLPGVFDQMPGGAVVGAIFFLLLMVAALTSSISMLEVPVSYFIDERKWSRKRAAIVIGFLALLLAIPSALSQGANETLSTMTLFGKTSFLDITDFVFGTFCVVLISFLLSSFSGWAIKTSGLVEELNEGSGTVMSKKILGATLSQIWIFFIRYVCPIALGIMIGKYVYDLI